SHVDKSQFYWLSATRKRPEIAIDGANKHKGKPANSAGSAVATRGKPAIDWPGYLWETSEQTAASSACRRTAMGRTRAIPGCRSAGDWQEEVAPPGAISQPSERAFEREKDCRAQKCGR